MDAKVNDVVQSLAGHDRGKLYLVKAVQGNRLQLTDGRLRRQDHLKSKSPKHVRTVGHCDAVPQTDREIRKTLTLAASTAAAKEDKYLGES